MVDTTCPDWSEEQWNNFRTWLEDILRDNIVTIIFTKADGTERTIQATKKSSIVTTAIERKKIMQTLTSDGIGTLKPVRAQRKDKSKDTLLLVWDTEADDWRTIKVKKILNILTLILKYDYKEYTMPF